MSNVDRFWKLMASPRVPVSPGVDWNKAAEFHEEHVFAFVSLGGMQIDDSRFFEPMESWCGSEESAKVAGQRWRPYDILANRSHEAISSQALPPHCGVKTSRYGCASRCGWLSLVSAVPKPVPGRYRSKSRVEVSWPWHKQLGRNHGNGGQAATRLDGQAELCRVLNGSGGSASTVNLGKVMVSSSDAVTSDWDMSIADA